MKKTQTLLCLFALAMTIGLASCKKDSNNQTPQSEATANMLKCRHTTTPPSCTPPPTTCGTPTVVQLTAGQHYNAGTVTVANDANNLYVTYTTTGSWRLDELHLFVGDCSQIPVTSTGNPVPGRFPYSRDVNNLQTYTFAIPLSSLGNCFCVAAHATVRSSSCGSETAWGAGTRFNTTTVHGHCYTGGGSWATYFTACKQTCTSNVCLQQPTILFANEGGTWPNNSSTVTVGGYTYDQTPLSSVYVVAPSSDAKTALVLIATLKIYGNTISPPSSVTSAATVVENWLATLGQLTETSQYTAPANVATAINTVYSWESSQYCPQ